MTSWIVVGLPENFEIAKRRKFDIIGFKSTRRRQAGEMRQGDKLVFYLTGVKKFGGIASVTSEFFEEHNRVFKSEKKPNEDFPFRVKTEAHIILDESQWLDVPELVPLLEMTKKGAMKSWSLAFQGNLHKISEADYTLIEREMKRRAGKKATSRTGLRQSAAIRVPAEGSGAKRKPAGRPRTKTASARSNANAPSRRR